MANLMMPGNPRYQPKDLIPHFGYDNLMKPVGQVEVANIQVLGEIGLIPAADMSMLTDRMIDALIAIPTTEVDIIERGTKERKGTKHDIRAWVYLAKQTLAPSLHRWVHLPQTSYDKLDTARALMFVQAYDQVIRPKIVRVVHLLADLVSKHADTKQIGRTHLQHGLPITVGFWLATLLSRVLYNLEEMDRKVRLVVGKISGAVGAYNAQVGLGFEKLCGDYPYELRVLNKLRIPPPPISTQIVPPEPLAYFLHSMVLTAAAFGQLGRDCRNLMRTEVAEVAEEFEEGQEGSSTMAHKRNPINFEQLEGMWLRTKNEYGKVLDTLISDHQRDLVGSSVARDFPIIPINHTVQLDTLLRANDKGVPFLNRIQVMPDALKRNFEMQANLVMGEPVYIAIQMAGYEGDAHKVVNQKAVALATQRREPIIDSLFSLADDDPQLAEALEHIPLEVLELLRQPEAYTGKSQQKALEIVRLAEAV